jgi:uncharacterized protein
MTDTSPRAVFERAQRALLDHDADGFADLFAEDGVLEAPFTPRTSAHGRDQLRREMTARGRAAHEAGVRLAGFRSLVVHETADPEVIVVEFVEDLVVGDRTHELPFVQVVRVRDGEIVSFRDYMDGVALREAVSGAPALQAALRGDQPPR